MLKSNQLTQWVIKETTKTFILILTGSNCEYLFCCIVCYQTKQGMGLCQVSENWLFKNLNYKKVNKEWVEEVQSSYELT